MLPVVAVLALCSACSGPQTGRLSLTTAGEATLPEELSSVDIDWDDGVTWTREVTCAVSGGLTNPVYEVSAFDRSIGEGIRVEMVLMAYDGPGSYERDEFQPTPFFDLSFEDELDRGDLDEPDREDPDDDEDGRDDDDSAGAGDDDDSAGTGDDDDSAGTGDDDDSAGTGDDDDSAADSDDDPEDERERQLGSTWRIGSDTGGSCLIEVAEDGLSGAFSCGALVAARERVLQPGDVDLSGSWTCSRRERSEREGATSPEDRREERTGLDGDDRDEDDREDDRDEDDRDDEDEG